MVLGYSFQKCTNALIEIACHKMINVQGADKVELTFREEQCNRVLLPTEQFRQPFCIAAHISDKSC
jgi:hypothetical protein